MGLRGPDVPPAPIAPRPRRAFRPPSLATLTEPAAFRLRVAIAMAALSLASAYVTHIATERASDAAGLESIAAQQAAEEQQVDQQIDAIVAQDLRLTARLDAHLQSYRRNQREAAAVRAANPERAVELDLAAQAEADQVRHLYPFFRGSFPDVTGNATYDAQAARDSLRGTDWRVFRASSGSTRLLADARRGTATAVVVSVVVLVLSLFLLTLGHLRGGRPGLAIAAGGAVASLAAITSFAVHAPEATPPLIAIAGVGLLLIAGARLVAQRRWLAGPEADETIVDLVDVPAAGGPAVAVANPSGPPVSRQARVVAVLIALATLLGSGVGYLHATASGRSDASGWEARNLAVEAIGALRAAEERLAVDTETYELALGQRVAAWSAAQQAGYADAVGQPVLAARLRDEERALLELADSTAGRSGIAAVLGDTGVHDPGVLQTLRSRIWESPARIAALQDAANTAAAAWGTQAALYVSVLAWLAVAAYLLGLSLVFQERRVQRVLTAIGLLLLVASLTRTVVVTIEPEPVGRESATLAADAYAAGFVALAADDLETAEARFTEAIEHRPDFAMARRERSQSIIRSGAAQRTGIQSVFSQAAVERAIEDMTAAGRAGFETPGLQLSLGAMQFHRSILADDPSAMEASVAATQRGLQLAGRLRDDAGRPHVNTVIAEANLGLSLLALDRTDEAATAYDEMIADTGRLGSFWHQQLVSSALTTLGILAEERPDLGSQVTAMKAQIVRGVFGTGQPATGEPASAAVTATTAEIFPSVVQWRATIPGLDPARDRLVTQWYRRDAVPNARWYALPLVSGPLELDRVAAGGSLFRDTGPDAYWGNSDALMRDVIPSCLGPAEYRLELYLNGRLAGNATGAVAQEPLTAHLSRDVGVAMCAPASWTVASGVPGVSTGIRSKDDSRGLLVFRAHQPLEPPADPRQTAIERVLRERADLLPAGLGSGQGIDPVTQPTVFGRNTNLWQRHAYAGGGAKLAATQSANGSGTILVAVIYGPDDWVDSIDAGRIAISLLEY